MDRPHLNLATALALAASMPSGVPLPNMRPSRRSRTPAPINWASYRPMLAEMLEARERILKIAEAYTSDGAGAEAVTFALRASSEYILELLRCIDTRPQGKGGWQRAARLDALLAQVEAALGAV